MPPSEGSDVIAAGSAFQIFAAATGKARSPMVLCNDRGTCMEYEIRRCAPLRQFSRPFKKFSDKTEDLQNIV